MCDTVSVEDLLCESSVKVWGAENDAVSDNVTDSVSDAVSELVSDAVIVAVAVRFPAEND